MTTTLNIILKRHNKIYHEGDTIAGVVEVSSPGEFGHEGLTLTAEGGVRLSALGRPPALLDAFANNVKALNVKSMVRAVPRLLQGGAARGAATLYRDNGIDPIPLVNTSLELLPAGRLPPGATELPFELPLQRCGSSKLLETYHGVFITISYGLKVTLKRSMFSKPLVQTTPFFVQLVPCEPPPLKPVRCTIAPSTVRHTSSTPLPHFLIHAELDTTVCSLDKPITGTVRVEESAAAIKSIELQLVRVETISNGHTTTRDATEIQNIQVGCGDVCRGIGIPLHTALPRLFAAPTTNQRSFVTEFELNLAIVFEDDHLVTENFPILLLRTR